MGIEPSPKEPTVAAGSTIRWPATSPSPFPYAGVILFERPRSSLELGAPAVCGVERDLLAENDLVELDGGAGTVDLPEVEAVEVVTAFLERGDGRILLLRRSERVGSFQGRWAGVSGFLAGAVPREQALREIEEECGLRPEVVHPVRQGVPVYARHGGRVFVVHPFRFRTDDERIRLDWEHTEFRWIRPEELGEFDTVPKLDRAWASVSSSEGPRQR